MRIFIFKSQANNTLRAFAGEAGGQKLPSQFGPWHAIGVIREAVEEMEREWAKELGQKRFAELKKLLGELG